MNPIHDSNRRKVHARQTQDYLNAARDRDEQVLKAISSQQKTADLEACGRRGGSREVIPPTTRRKPEIV